MNVTSLSCLGEGGGACLTEPQEQVDLGNIQFT